MAKQRRARDLGLDICVCHPQSEVGELRHKEETYGDQCDADGHYMSVGMVPMRGQYLVELMIRRGMSATSAASILRKIADRIELNGDPLLNLIGSTSGQFMPDGRFKDDGLGNDDSDTPELLDPSK